MNISRILLMFSLLFSLQAIASEDGNSRVAAAKARIKKAVEESDENLNGKEFKSIQQVARRNNVPRIPLVTQLRQEARKNQETYEHVCNKNDGDSEEELGVLQNDDAAAGGRMEPETQANDPLTPVTGRNQRPVKVVKRNTTFVDRLQQAINLPRVPHSGALDELSSSVSLRSDDDEDVENNAACSQPRLAMLYSSSSSSHNNASPVGGARGLVAKRSQSSRDSEQVQKNSRPNFPLAVFNMDCFMGGFAEGMRAAVQKQRTEESDNEGEFAFEPRLRKKRVVINNHVDPHSENFDLTIKNMLEIKNGKNKKNAGVGLSNELAASSSNEFNTNEFNTNGSCSNKLRDRVNETRDSRDFAEPRRKKRSHIDPT